MTEYRRHRLKGGTYFFTVNLAERNRELLTERIDVLRESFRAVKYQHPFNIDAIVILPEHLHTIWTLPEGDDDFSCRWRQIRSHCKLKADFFRSRRTQRHGFIEYTTRVFKYHL